MAKAFQWNNGPSSPLQTPKYAALQQTMEDKVPTSVELATLMAVIQNCWIRALNGVYQVAPHVLQGDYANFLGYTWNVCQAVWTHHHEEESFVFPLIEKMTGAEGLMAGNVAQHHASEKGLDKFASYVSSLISTGNTASLSAQKFRELIDAFTEPLQTHLEEEIATLLELAEFPHIDLAQPQQRAHKETLAHYKMGQMRDEMPVLLLNHDAAYEDGIHGMFPDMPLGMGFVLRRVVTCYHWGYWRYASCDSMQRPKELPFVERAGSRQDEQ